MNRRVYGSTFAAIALSLSGCASIVSGTSQTLSFQSTPEGATVTVSGRVLGKTPVSALLKKEKNQNVVFTLDGHKPVTMQLTTHLDNWFWGNIVFGGFLGSTTDSLSGAVHQYSPTQYYVTLAPDTKTPDNKTSRSRDHKVRDLVVFRYDALMRELNTGHGEGETFGSLVALIGIPPSETPAAWAEFGRLARSHADPVRYASALVERYPEGGR